MKKHDEGYALALVLVVLTVICLVALTMMSVSLANVTRQQATLQRMEEKYAAQGEIEKVVARLESLLLSSNVTGIINIRGSSVEQACAGPVENVQDRSGGTPVVQYKEFKFADGKITFILETVIPGNTTQIACKIRITGAKIEEKSQGDDTYYAVTAPAIEYDSYSIEYISRGGDGA